MTRPAVEPGAAVELRVESIGAGGSGVGRLPDGRAVFVHRTAPGDMVRAELTRVRKRWARARLGHVIEPGPHRRPPPCPHYERCGGCTLEHLEYHAQLEAKGTIVVEALRRIGKRIDLPAPELHPSPREVRYRNRVTFALRRLPGGRVVAGFHELERPDRILDVDGRCLLPEGPVAETWDALRVAWGPGADRLPPGDRLRVTLRGTEDGAVIMVVEPDRTADGPGATPAAHATPGTGQAPGTDHGDPEALVREVPGLAAVWGRSPGGEAALLAGEDEVEEVWYGERVRIHPDAFLQVNRRAAEHLHDLVLREAGVPRGRLILDAYCGVGVYGRRLAAHGAAAVGIEADPGAAAMARDRPVEGFRLLEGRVEDRLDEALPVDLAILNPPRTGVAEGVMERLGAGSAGRSAVRPDRATASSGRDHAGSGDRKAARSAVPPARILYVSCDPATLARDVERLGTGYRISRLQVVDLFPQTAHVETVLTLDRAEDANQGAPGR